MSDLRKVKPGDPLRISAGDYNDIIDAARANKARGGGGVPIKTGGQTGTVFIKNNSGADVPRFGILGIDGPLISATDNESEFINRPSLEGVAVSVADHLGKYAIAQEPIADGKIGKAKIDGLTVAKVNIATEGDVYAEIVDAENEYLASGLTGSARIIAADPGTGEKWCLVRLNDPSKIIAELTSEDPNHPGHYAWTEQINVAGAWDAKPNGLSGTIEFGYAQEYNGRTGLLALAGVSIIVELTPVRTGVGLVWMFTDAIPQEFAYVGYGIPADGQSDTPMTNYVVLTVTDSTGEPKLDSQDEEYTIKVYRNATRRAVYLDFQSDTIFQYVVFQGAVFDGSFEGCLFASTDSFRGDEIYLPTDGYEVFPGVNTPPVASDGTGDPATADDVYVTGKMYMDDYEGEAGAWKPWICISGNYIHALATETPEDVDPDTEGDVGTSAKVAREDHRHDHAAAGDEAATFTPLGVDEESNVVSITPNVLSIDQKGHSRGAEAGEADNFGVVPTPGVVGATLVSNDSAPGAYVWAGLTTQTVITDIQWNMTTHKFEKKTRSVIILADGDESEWTQIVAGTPCVPA